MVLSLGGLGVLWVAGRRKEPVCWFSLKAQLCELTEAFSKGPKHSK